MIPKKRLTEAERQVIILRELPPDGSKIRVSDLCESLSMSPRKVNVHLEALMKSKLVSSEYFPGERAPLRLVWLTNPHEDNYPKPTKGTHSSGRKAKKLPLSRRRKVKNKVEEILN